MPIVSAIAANEKALAEAAADLHRAWRNGARTLRALFCDPDERAFIAEHLGMSEDAPLNLDELATFERVLHWKIVAEQRGFTMLAQSIRLACWKAIRS
jgi:hypothetical protein